MSAIFILGGELNAAISVFKSHHINRGQVDWPAVEAHAAAMIVDAQSAADAYPAIWYVIHQMGEKHSHLVPPEVWTASFAGAATHPPSEMEIPTVARLEDHVAVIRIPTFQGTEDADREFVGKLRVAIARARRAGVCRYIVDLRENTGGDNWVMTGGIRALLGNAKLGYWDIGSGVRVPLDVPDRPWAEHEPWPANYSPGVSPQTDAWVAVLIDRNTWSAAEFTAIAFEGRPRTRFFGEPSGGYLAGLEHYRLPDGAMLMVAQSWPVDRLGRPYRIAVVPDVGTPRGALTVAVAGRWLHAQSCTNEKGRAMKPGL